MAAYNPHFFMTSPSTTPPSLDLRFVGSLVIHEGALVANYPFDGYPDGSHDSRRIKNPSPDDATFVFLARTYASLHKTMVSPDNRVSAGSGYISGPSRVSAGPYRVSAGSGYISGPSMSTGTGA